MMLWQYIGQVFGFAFRRTTPAIDSLQIIAASAVPAIAKLVGVKMAAAVTSDVLAYIGAFAVAFVVIRLVCAPYFIWRDQVGVIGVLKLELSKPERLELEHIAKIRAKARVKLAKSIRLLQNESFFGDSDGELAESLRNDIVRLHAEVSPSPAFTSAYSVLTNEILRLSRVESDSNTEEGALMHKKAMTIAYRLGEWLHGRVTDAALLPLLLPDTEEETRP